MTTRRKRWPNEAEWARQEALSYARRGVKATSAMLQTQEVTREIAIANDCLHQIVTALIQVGPMAEQKASQGVEDPKEARRNVQLEYSK